MSIRAGEYRDRFKLQTYSEGAADGQGGFSDPSWPTSATVWARDRPLTGSERFEAAQTQSNVSREVEIRFRSGIDSTMRLVKVGSTGTVYGIEAVFDPDQRRERLSLLCSEGAPTPVVP